LKSSRVTLQLVGDGKELMAGALPLGPLVPLGFVVRVTEIQVFVF
jgi:hypothetical protein